MSQRAQVALLVGGGALACDLARRLEGYGFRMPTPCEGGPPPAGRLDPAAWSRTFGELRDRYGALDLLVNVCCLAPPAGPPPAPEAWGDLVEARLTPVYLALRACPEAMATAASPLVVNVTTELQPGPAAWTGVAAGIRAALESLTHVAAAEFAIHSPAIRVNAVRQNPPRAGVAAPTMGGAAALASRLAELVMLLARQEATAVSGACLELYAS